MMTIEKAIQHLKNMAWLDEFKNTTVNGKSLNTIIFDIINLLKEQEPAKPYGKYSEHMDTKWLICGACEQPMIKITPDAIYPNYCPNCGRKVWYE